MKRILIIILGTGVAAGLLAQSIITNGGTRSFQPPSYGSFQPLSYDPKTRPPLALPDAYALAMRKLAEIPGATNRFHCISGSCVEMSCRNGWTGWTFWFANTNGDHAYLWVFFDRHVATEPWSSQVFRK